MDFKQFLIEQRDKEVSQTLSKLPKNIRNLVHGFNFKFKGSHTLDGTNVGELDNKKITVAAPYFHCRELVVLHEIGHVIWEKLPQETKEKWQKIVNNTKGKQKQNAEELFCMAFGATYTKHPPTTHSFPKWIEFIKNLDL